MGKSDIEWTESSHNFYTWNCNKVSPGCAHCYAATMASNFGGKWSNNGKFIGSPDLIMRRFEELRKLKSGPVFVNSMSDTYHEGVPVAWINRIHLAAYANPNLTFLLLTKRIERAAKIAHLLPWPRNLWIGTTVERDDYLWRLDHLRRLDRAAGRFVSFEPLLGPVTPDLTGLDWVIVGGESGNYKRPFDKDWAETIRLEAEGHDIPFFFKQGSAFRSGQDRLLHGRTWDGVPAAFNWTPKHAPAAPVQLALTEAG